MRQSFKTELLKTEDGTVYALYAEADFCAEHEQGVGPIHRAFGCGSVDVDGIARYQPSEASIASGRLFSTGTTKGWSRPEGKKRKNFVLKTLTGVRTDYIRDDVYIDSTPRPASTSFDDRNFAIISFGKDTDDFIDTLVEHAAHCDVAVFMGGAAVNPFGRGGLVVAIPSLCPQNLLDTLYEAHVNKKLLTAASEATGIVQRVEEKQNGRGYQSPFFLYAISPKWSEEIKSTASGPLVTEHDVLYWLNNGKNIFGWYTVEDIDQWLDGHGPVVDDAEMRAAEAEKHDAEKNTRKVGR